MDDPGQLQAAFRELHAERLHGFALLLMLGDRPAAAELAIEAIDAAADRAAELRHPERGAAWLRARVVRRGRGAARRARGVAGRRPAQVSPGRGGEALAALGVSPAAQAGLAALDPTERAALVAAFVEGLSPLDTGTIVGAQGSRLTRLMRRARERYATAFVAHAGTDRAPAPGLLTERVLDVADRALR